MTPEETKIASPKSLLAPTVLLLLFVLLVVAYQMFDLPGKEELVLKAQGYYERHGYLTVFLGSAIEGLLFVNWYFPGSIIAVTGVVFAKTIGMNVFAVVGLIIAGFFLSGMVNYSLGRYGWYRLLLKMGLEKPLQTVKLKMERWGLFMIFGSYLHPNVGALAATSAGILGFEFKKFALYSFWAIVLWNTIWGLVVYFSGTFILDIIGPWFVGATLVFWLGLRLYRKYIAS